MEYKQLFSRSSAAAAAAAVTLRWCWWRGEPQDVWSSPWKGGDVNRAWWSVDLLLSVPRRWRAKISLCGKSQRADVRPRISGISGARSGSPSAGRTDGRTEGEREEKKNKEEGGGQMRQQSCNKLPGRECLHSKSAVTLVQIKLWFHRLRKCHHRRTNSC